MKRIKFKKLHPEAATPVWSKDNAGIDLTAVSFKPEELYIEYDTGIAFEIPEGYVGLLFPRSSVSNTGLFLANSVGVVDSSYRGTIKARFYSTSDRFRNSYNVGDRVCQLVIIPVPEIILMEADELSSTQRGEGGFGSTGK